MTNVTGGWRSVCVEPAQVRTNPLPISTGKSAVVFQFEGQGESVQSHET